MKSGVSTLILLGCGYRSVLGLQVIDSSKARALLRTSRTRQTFRRVDRANGFGDFESLGGDNYKQECVEEQCVLEEFVEARDEFPDQASAEKSDAWLNIFASCNQYQCTGRGTYQCWRYWAHRECKCWKFKYDYTDKNGKAQSVELPAFYAGEGYKTPASYPKPQMDGPVDDIKDVDGNILLKGVNARPGACSDYNDICDLYQSHQNVDPCKAIDENSSCFNLVPNLKSPKPKNAGEFDMPDFLSKNVAAEQRDYEPQEPGQVVFKGYACKCKPRYERKSVDGPCEPMLNPCDSENACPSDSSCFPMEDYSGFSCICNDEMKEHDQNDDICVPRSCFDFGDKYCKYKHGEVAVCNEGDFDSGKTLTCGCPATHALNEEDQCADVDECALNTHNCKSCQNCINTDGGFTCETMSGYIEDCADIDECANGQHNCQEGTHCRNYLGSFSCCDNPNHMADWEGKCVDPCSIEENQLVCRENAICMADGLGGTEEICPCKEGFVDNEDDVCVDVNECSDGLSCSGEFQICVNTEGSYECNCQVGYAHADENDKESACELSDPCLLDNPCTGEQKCFAFGADAICCEGYEDMEPESGVCHDLPSGVCVDFVCPEFTNDYTQCKLVKTFCGPVQSKDLPPGVQNEAAPTDCGGNMCFGYCLSWDDEKFVCVDKMPKNTEFPGIFDDCDDGLEMKFEDKQCYDIDECQVDNGGCEDRCMNFYKTHYCYSDPNEYPKFCHHTYVADDSFENGYSCDCFNDYGLCEDSFTCTAAHWDSSARAISDIHNKMNTNHEQCYENQVSFGEKCYQQSSTSTKNDVAISFCQENNGQLALVNSRELWFILAFSLKTDKTTESGMEPFWINIDSDEKAANMVLLPAETPDQDTHDAKATNIQRDMKVVPPSFNWVSNTLDMYFYCEYDPGYGHDSIPDQIVDYVDAPEGPPVPQKDQEMS